MNAILEIGRQNFDGRVTEAPKNIFSLSNSPAKFVRGARANSFVFAEKNLRDEIDALSASIAEAGLRNTREELNDLYGMATALEMPEEVVRTSSSTFLYTFLTGALSAATLFAFYGGMNQLGYLMMIPLAAFAGIAISRLSAYQ